MSADKCLYCYEPLAATETDYHPRCSKKFFGTEVPPAFDYSISDMEKLAREIVIKSVAVTGVQPKVSLDIERYKNDPKHSRLTLVGLWGQYILKPPTGMFRHVPENEDLTMHLAAIADISVADHSLIRLKSGELSYITKRFDRIDGDKIPLEDMCQLTETLTEDKYRGSMEKVGKHILKYASFPKLDALRYFQLALFCFVTGNADMHLKNFSLITGERGKIMLSPAYDLLNTKIVMPEDNEEMALTLNGKKSRLKRADFDALANSLSLPEKAVKAVYDNLAEDLPRMLEMISKSFLPMAEAVMYKDMLIEKMKKLGLV